jgi:hypothetical protein
MWLVAVAVNADVGFMHPVVVGAVAASPPVEFTSAIAASLKAHALPEPSGAISVMLANTLPRIVLQKVVVFDGVITVPLEFSST